MEMERKWILIVGGGIAAVALVVVAAVVGAKVIGDAGAPITNAAPGASLPEGFVLFQDRQAGIQIAYPKDWQKVQEQDPQVRLLVTPNRKDSFLVRVVPLPERIDPKDVRAARQFLLGQIRGPGKQILAAEQISVSDVPGWYFLYTFEDAASGQTGVHSHYFLFRGNRLDILVFQGLPKQRFQVLAPTFDLIANSYRPL